MGQDRRQWVSIQINRVLYAIVARGLLSLQEIRICAYIWGNSWGRGSKKNPQNRTPPRVTSSAIAAVNGMDRGIIRRTLGRLIADGVVIRHPDGSLEFNEHTDQWRRVKSTRQSVSNRHAKACQIDTCQIDTACQIDTPKRVKSTRKACQIDTPPYISESHSSQKNKSSHNSGCARKKRAPTAVEKCFLDGFKKLYNADGLITRDHAIRLNQLVGQFGETEVLHRIGLWWDHEQGKWAGVRDIGAFLRTFGRLMEDNGNDDRRRPDETIVQYAKRMARERNFRDVHHET